MSEQKINDQLAIAMVNAARDIAVAKITAKGARFDGYSNHFNWFAQSLNEVVSACKGKLPGGLTNER